MADIGETEKPHVIDFEPMPEEVPVVPAEPRPEVVPARPEPQPA